jgi:predicted nucleic acid-binding protein
VIPDHISLRYLSVSAVRAWRSFQALLSISTIQETWYGLLFMGVPDLDPRFSNNFIDANVLDRTGGPEDAAVDEILQLRGGETFTVLLPNSVKTELAHPNTPAEVKQRAAELVYSVPVQLTSSELATHDKIRALIQGNAKPGQHDSDAFHLVESAKYGRHFITNDERLLKKAEEIWKMLHLKVIKPSEFLAAYRTHTKG